ncbi:MAG: hypothetical protein Q8R88_09955, partial [Desulfoprunum sp.]|nr:hypothetical protein [Desulfoprunum sp.]
PFFFTIKNFASGSYGITLADYTPQETDFTFSGTSAKSTGMVQLRQDSDGDHWYYRFFRRQADGTTTVDDRDFTLANIPSLDVTGSDGRDFLYGLTKSDILRGGRTDVLAANNGADDYYWRLAA